MSVLDSLCGTRPLAASIEQALSLGTTLREQSQELERLFIQLKRLEGPDLDHLAWDRFSSVRQGINARWGWICEQALLGYGNLNMPGRQAVLCGRLFEEAMVMKYQFPVIESELRLASIGLMSYARRDVYLGLINEFSHRCDALVAWDMVSPLRAARTSAIARTLLFYGGCLAATAAILIGAHWLLATPSEKR